MSQQDSNAMKMFPVVWPLVLALLGGAAWVTTIQVEVAALKAKAIANETRLSRIEFYVIQIAEKVGVKVEPPRG